jgi:hypothetical protein
VQSGHTAQDQQKKGGTEFPQKGVSAGKEPVQRRQGAPPPGIQVTAWDGPDDVGHKQQQQQQQQQAPRSSSMPRDDGGVGEAVRSGKSLLPSPSEGTHAPNLSPGGMSGVGWDEDSYECVSPYSGAVGVQLLQSLQVPI